MRLPIPSHSPYEDKKLTHERNVFESIKLLGVVRCVAGFSQLSALFQVLQFVMPSISAKRKRHLEFTRRKVEERFERKTKRKDFVSYVSEFSRFH